MIYENRFIQKGVVVASAWRWLTSSPSFSSSSYLHLRLRRLLERSARPGRCSELEPLNFKLGQAKELFIAVPASFVLWQLSPGVSLLLSFRFHSLLLQFSGPLAARVGRAAVGSIAGAPERRPRRPLPFAALDAFWRSFLGITAVVTALQGHLRSHPWLVIATGTCASPTWDQPITSVTSLGAIFAQALFFPSTTFLPACSSLLLFDLLFQLVWPSPAGLIAP